MSDIVKKRKALTAENEKLWAAAEAKRTRCDALRNEAYCVLGHFHPKSTDLLFESDRLSKEADEEQADITISRFFEEATDDTLAVVKHYEYIVASGKCINGCNARHTSNALDAQFEKKYPAKETDDDIALVRVLGTAAWSALVTRYEDSPRYEDANGRSTNGLLGYTTLLKHTEAQSRMLSQAIRLCFKSQTCAIALIDCAMALGVTDELYYHMLDCSVAMSMGQYNLGALIHTHSVLLGHNKALALGYANHCTVEYWMHDAHFNDFVELVKHNPAWFAFPRLVRNLADPGHGSETKAALRALRILACLDPAFLHEQVVDLGHLIGALKGNKKHLKRLETLVAKIENPKHRNMAAEHAAAMAMGLDG